MLVLVPAILTLLLEDRIATAAPRTRRRDRAVARRRCRRRSCSRSASYYTLGFALYSLIYAAAGSLVSRPEDLQIIALPLSLLAIVGYIQAILALTGGITGFIRFASLVPFWSPFVMLTRLSVGRVEPIEIVVSISLLVVTIVVTAVVAIRIYAAGVLLYGQRPGLRAYIAAARHGGVGRRARPAARGPVRYRTSSAGTSAIAASGEIGFRFRRVSVPGGAAPVRPPARSVARATRRTAAAAG